MFSPSVNFHADKANKAKNAQGCFYDMSRDTEQVEQQTSVPSVATD